MAKAEAKQLTSSTPADDRVARLAEFNAIVPNAAQGDRCDTMLANDNSPDWNDRQRRFLGAYRERPTVAPAARLAGVHRATVYRWLTEPGFADAMRDAADAFYQAHRAKVLAQDAARQRWRDERERERRPMRCDVLARARAARGLA